jgi:hypothetical protein
LGSEEITHRLVNRSQKRVNMTGTDQKISTHVARGRSGPVRYELIDKDGKVAARHSSAAWLADRAKEFWPDQEQDEDRTGKGWDVQVAGCE